MEASDMEASMEARGARYDAHAYDTHCYTHVCVCVRVRVRARVCARARVHTKVREIARDG